MTHDKYIATPSRTQAIMEAFDLTTKKSLGQNFLVEPSILHKMIEAGEVTQETVVIEIGPGIGALTEFLAQSARKVLAFEIDQRFIEVLDETLAPYDNVEVIHQDILTVDFQDPAYAWLYEVEDLMVVANLPYYITTPIIMHLLASDLPFTKLLMMMQKEVAERLTAQVGTKAYGSLTVALENLSQAEISFIVPPTVFMPRPKVESAVLKLTRRPQALEQVQDDLAFQDFVQATFTQRRKTLWNNLRMVYAKPGLIPTAQLQAALEEADIDPSRRAETLTLAEFATLYRSLFEV